MLNNAGRLYCLLLHFKKKTKGYLCKCSVTFYCFIYSVLYNSHEPDLNLYTMFCRCFHPWHVYFFQTVSLIFSVTHIGVLWYLTLHNIILNLTHVKSCLQKSNICFVCPAGKEYTFQIPKELTQTVLVSDIFLQVNELYNDSTKRLS